MKHEQENVRSSVAYIATFLETLTIEKNISNNTLQSYKKDLSQLENFFTKISVINIDTTDIERYIISIKEKYSITTVARKISALKSFYKFLYAENIIKNNPMLKLENAKINRALPYCLSQEEIGKLLETSSVEDSLKGVRDYTIIEMLYATGMRVSEITQLKITDILPLLNAKNYITIKGKGNKERMLIFNEQSIIAIQKYYSLTKNSNNSAWLFFSNNEKSITRQYVGKMLKTIAIKSNINPSKVYPHVIRHSFATHLLEKGMKIKVIKELLGHKSISTTQIYTYICNTKLKEVLENSHPLAHKK